MPSLIPTGQILLQSGLIDERQLQSALSDQKSRGGRLGEALARLGLLTERALLAEIAFRCGVPFIEIGDRAVDPFVTQLVPERYIRSRKIFPIAYTAGRGRGILVLATSEPRRLSDADEIARLTGMTVRTVLAGARDVERAIERHFGTARHTRPIPSNRGSAPRCTPTSVDPRTAG